MGSVRTSILEDLDAYPRTSRPPSPTPSSAKSLINPGFFKGKEIEVGSVRQETDMTPFDAAADHASAEREEHLQHETGR
jgi:hypothetical protein